MVKKIIFNVIACVLLMSCASNPGVINVSPDTYLISKTDMSGVFGNPNAFKAKVFEEAQQFAASKGKFAIPLTVDETPMGAGRLYSIDLQFRVVAKDDDEYKRVTLEARPDFVSESKASLDINISDSQSSSRQGETVNLYDELIKLDDLKNRGIISDDEFRVAKKKLLER